MRLFKILVSIGTVFVVLLSARSSQAASVSIYAPSDFLAKAKAATQITICWKESSDNETGFIVEQKTGSCESSNPWEQIADLPANSLRYTVSGLSPNTTYSFRAYAYNASTNSDYSNCASASTAALGTPPAPTNLKAESESSDAINLNWTGISTNEDGFEIWRKAGSDSWELLSTTGPDITTYKDNTAYGNISSTSFRYFVLAYNSLGDSPMTYPVIVPFQPQNLSVNIITKSGKVKIMWSETASEKNGFEIWRKSGSCSSSETWTLAGKAAGNREFWYDAGVTSGNTYSYKVRGYKRTGNMLAAYGYSGWSDCESLEIISPDDYDDDGDGYSENEGDCDDNDSSTYPGATEICGDGIDQDCDGNDLACEPDPNNVDNDGDGYTVNQGDCDDNNISVYPDAPEILCDGTDQDCDGDDYCVNDGDDCEIVINTQGPGFLKVTNNTNGYILVMLPEYAFGACVRPNVCELYGLDLGYRTVEISQCSDDDNECDNCNWTSTEERTINIQNDDTYEIVVNNDFFQEETVETPDNNCTDGCWRKVTTLPNYQMYFAEIWGSSSDDVFINGSEIFHFDGADWTPVTPNRGFYTVWGTSASDVYAFTYDGILFQYDGVSWNDMGKIYPYTVWDIWGTSSSDIFVVGNGPIIHYDGYAWTSTPNTFQDKIRGVWGTSSSNVYIIPESYYIYEYEGTEWTQIYNGENYHTFSDIWGTSPSNIFVVGEQGLILHFNGSSWNILNSGTTETLYAIWGASNDNIFAVGTKGTILHYDGNSWSSMLIDTSENLLAVWGASGDDVFVVSEKGAVFRY